jgi:predicted ATPase/DNA-binding SARP family transcriptional activator
VPALTICLFGPFEVQLNGAPLPRLRSRKGLWLLALLILRHGREVERDWLAGTLWPESAPAQAFHSLNMSLTDLRRALGPDAGRLRSPTRRTLCLDLLEAEADVLAFEAAIARGDPPSLEQAVALYRGPFLEGCIEEWAFQERQVREQQYLGALETLAALAQAQGDATTAVSYLRRAVAVDPLRESAQRALMQALALGGNYAAALLVYRELRLLLHRELNAAPDPETQALFERLRAEARRRATGGGPGCTSRLPRTAEGEPTPPPLAAADLERQEMPGAVHQRDPGMCGPLESLSEDDFPLIDAGTPAGSSGLPLVQAPDHNLPVQLTRFIGREREMAEVRRLLASTHLLTLTGAGGCGKTRLALQAAASVLEEFPDGVWLVELAPLVDPTLVPQAVAAVLGVREQPGRSVAETLLDRLRPRFLLLVLDNCEHLLTAVAQLAERLLRACPHLRILATSREGLNIVGEQMFRVPPLPVPPDVDRGSWIVGRPNGLLPQRSTIPDPASDLLQYEAVQLFVDRAGASQPGFAVTAGNAPAVAQVCRRLDGIPLAIELAAARVRVLPVEQIHARLDDMFRLLTGGSRTALPRQQTLRAAIDWSYELLTEAERTLLRRLSVFAGGWTLEAAEGVCAGDGIEAWEVLDVLTGLVDKSLVIVDEQGEQPRYRLLETVRQYGRERLLEAGEEAAVRGRHRDWCLALAEQGALPGESERAWYDRLEREHDNLRAALAWSKVQGQGEVGLRLGGALPWFWERRGYWTEGREQLAGLLALPGAQARTAVRAEALYGAGWLAHDQGEYGPAQALIEEGLAIFRELGDKGGIATSLGGLGKVAHHQGDYGAARALYEECLTIQRELGNKGGNVLTRTGLGGVARAQGDYGAARAIFEEALAIHRERGNKSDIAWSLSFLGNVASDQRNYEEAWALFEESLAIHREAGDKCGIAWLLNRLGRVALSQGNYEAARALLEESLAIHRELGSKWGIAWSLCFLGTFALSQGDYGAARALLEESLAIFRELGSKWGIASILEGLAALAVAQAQSERAARLFGAEEGLREAMGAPLPPADRAEHDRSVAAVRTALGEEGFAAAWAEGQRMELEQAIACALEADCGWKRCP